MRLRTTVQASVINHSATIDGGAAAHIISDVLANKLFNEGLITSVNSVETTMQIMWGAGSPSPVIAIARSLGLLKIMYVVKDISTPLLISENQLCQDNIIIIKNSTTLIGLQHGQIVLFAETRKENGEEIVPLFTIDVFTLFTTIPITQQSPSSAHITNYLSALLNEPSQHPQLTVLQRIRPLDSGGSGDAIALQAIVRPSLLNPSSTLQTLPNNPLLSPSLLSSSSDQSGTIVALSARPKYATTAVRAAYKALQGCNNMSGDQIALIVQAGAMDDIPDHLQNEALWRAVQRNATNTNVAWLISKKVHRTLGGSGVICTTPGTVAHLDFVGVMTINGHKISFLFIVDEGTSKWTTYLLSRKKTMSYAMRLYILYTQSLGHTVQAFRSDPESTLGLQALTDINNNLGEGNRLNILEPFSTKVYKEYQRSHSGTIINKTACEENEKRAERSIRTLGDSAINAMICQSALPAEYYGYAVLDSTEKANGNVGKDGMSRHEAFENKRPHWDQYTAMSFGSLALCRRVRATIDKGEKARNSLVAVLVSPLALRGQRLVLEADNKHHIPVMRGGLTGIPQGHIKHTAADWQSFVPEVNDNGDLVSLKSGTRELFTLASVVRNQQQRQLDPTDPAALTDAQRIHWKNLTGNIPKQGAKEDGVEEPANDEEDAPVDEEEEDNDQQQQQQNQMEVDIPQGAEVWSTDHESIGARVAGAFEEGKIFAGIIDRYLPAHNDEHGQPLPDIFHLKYDDGDEEELWGQQELQHAKDRAKLLPNDQQQQPVYLMPAAQPSDAVRRSNRLAQLRALTAKLLTPQQLLLMLGDKEDAPSQATVVEPLPPVAEITAADEVMCVPTSVYDEAGIPRDSITADRFNAELASQHPQLTVLQGIRPLDSGGSGDAIALQAIVRPSLLNLSSTIQTLPNNSLLSHSPLPSQSTDQESTLYSREDIELTQLFSDIYQQQPTEEDMNMLRYLANLVGKHPTSEEVREYNSPSTNNRQSIIQPSAQVAALKARITRTEENPSSNQVEKSASLQATFNDAVRTFIDGGIAKGHHQFINPSTAAQLNVIIVPGVPVYKIKRTGKPSFRLTMDGGKDPTVIQSSDTYSAGIDTSGFKYAMALCAEWNLELRTCDATAAFPSLNHVESIHVKHPRSLACWISPYLSGTGRRELLLFQSIPQGSVDAPYILEAITVEQYLRSLFRRSSVVPQIFFQRKGESIAIALLYVDDSGRMNSRDEVARAMFRQLEINEKEAGFSMTFSPYLDEASIDYTAVKITKVNCPVHGPCIQLTQPSIMTKIKETLENSTYGKKDTETFTPSIPQWSAFTSHQQFKRGETTACDQDFYMRLLGILLWAEQLSKTSAIASQLATRTHECNQFDMSALVQACEYRYSMRDIPLVFQIKQGVINNTIPPRIFAHVDAGADGSLKEHGRRSSVFIMGDFNDPTNISGSFNSSSAPCMHSSNTATDELDAIGNGTNRALIFKQLGEELSGNSPGILNTKMVQSKFGATMIFTSSMLSETIEEGIEQQTPPSELIVNMQRPPHPVDLFSDSKVLVDIITTLGKTPNTKRMTHASREVAKAMHLQELHITQLHHVSSLNNRSNSLGKLPPGPLEAAEKNHMVNGHSTQLDEYRATVQRKYAKRPSSTSSPTSIMALQARVRADYQPSTDMHQTTTEPDFRIHHLVQLEARDTDTAWIHHTSRGVLKLLMSKGYEPVIDTIANEGTIASVPTVSTKEGIGYDVCEKCNDESMSMWIRGSQPIVSITVSPPTRIDTSAEDQYLLNQLTARNTILNSNDQRAEATEQLINQGKQWVFNAESANTNEELQELENHQVYLRYQLSQRPKPSMKRPAGSDINRQQQQQQRWKGEQQKRPTMHYFGSISSSEEKHFSKQLPPQLSSDQLKQPCIMGPGLRSPVMYHEGSAATGISAPHVAKWGRGPNVQGDNRRGKGSVNKQKSNKRSLFLNNR